MQKRRLSCALLAAATLVAHGHAAAPCATASEAPSPFRVFDGRGRQLRQAEVLDFEAGGSELDGLKNQSMLPAALSHFMPRAPGRSEKRRGFFSRLFGLNRSIPATPPPLETQYPVVMLHGANTPRKTHLGPITLKYFSKTEAHLRRLNLRLFIPAVNPFGSIQERGEDLVQQISRAIPEGQFNLIGHSMGGLDARWLATHSVLKDRVASITTVSTPHHGAWYADFAEKWLFKRQGLNKLGSLVGMRFDQIPDLTVRNIQANFNPTTPDNPNVAYFSYGTATSAFKSPPWFWGMNFITRISEVKAAKRAGRRAAKGMALPGRGTIPHGLRSKRGEVRIDSSSAAAVAAVGSQRDASWVVPGWAGRNDGVVSLSSSVWGTYRGTIKTHHWGPMGWASRFPEAQFWEQVIRRIKADCF